MKNKFIFAFCLLMIAGTTWAQTSKIAASKYGAVSKEVMAHYGDSLKNAIVERDSSTVVFSPNPYYFRLFAPFTYYYGPVNSALRVLETEAADPFAISSGGFDKKNTDVQGAVDRALLNAYLNSPTAVVNSEQNIMKRSGFRDSTIIDAREVKATDVMEKAPLAEGNLKEDVVPRKPNFWKKKGNASLQFSQNYFSGNWYKGGESTNTLLSAFTYEANYNDEQKVEWDNKLELKLGFVSSRADSLHKYKTNNDLIRLASKLGIRAAKYWYYTIQGEFNSQFMPGYKSNDATVYSNFFAPANLVFSIGMDYKRETKKWISSVYISPLAYNFRYVGDDKVDVEQYGIRLGHRTLNDFGSKLEVNAAWKIIKNVSWKTRLYYFTNYKKAEAEWENTIELAVSKYLATQIFVHGRFDDGASRIEGHSYFQLKEFLSVGLSYNW